MARRHSNQGSSRDAEEALRALLAVAASVALILYWTGKSLGQWVAQRFAPQQLSIGIAAAALAGGGGLVVWHHFAQTSRGWIWLAALAMVSLFAGIVLGVLVQVAANRESDRLARSGIHDVDAMSGSEFEAFLANHFARRGYRAEQTPASGDYGADVVLEDVQGRRIVVQAKRYSGSVGNDAVMAVVASKATYRATHAMVITNAQFTRAAMKQAADNGVELWDRERLIREMLESQ